MEGRIQKLYLTGTHSGTRYESNALLWLRNMGHRPERTL